MNFKSSDPIPFQIRSNYQLGAFQNPAGADYRNFPVRLSIPVAEGVHRPDQTMQVLQEKGEAAPAPIRPFLFWSDGSVRAWEVWLHATLHLGETRRYELLPVPLPSDDATKLDAMISEPHSFSVFVTLKEGIRLKGDARFNPHPAGAFAFLIEDETSFPLKRGAREIFRGALHRRRWSGYPGVELALRLTNVGPDDSLMIREARVEFDLPLKGAPEYTVEQIFHSRNRLMPAPRFVRSRKPFILQSNAGDVRVTDIRQLGDDPKFYPSYERPGALVVAPWTAVSDEYIHARFDVIKATGREGGWTLIALGALYDLTREERYLEGIRRVVDWYLSQKPGEFFPENGSYFVGIALIGLDRVRSFYRDKEIQKFIPGILDWQIENRMSGEGLFDFHFDSESEGGCAVQAAMPEALNIGWLISGDERYLRVALRQFQFWEAGTLFHSIGNVATDSRVAASAQFSWMGCLQSFAEKGWLDRMQLDDPGKNPG
ncbi:MAG: hypothetical protein HY360_07740 [Verrucomicrobia bacterium]|nr:hypothetical protein [Verrucomicrobiota bacterium]